MLMHVTTSASCVQMGGGRGESRSERLPLHPSGLSFSRARALIWHGEQTATFGSLLDGLHGDSSPSPLQMKGFDLDNRLNRRAGGGGGHLANGSVLIDSRAMALRWPLPHWR